MSKPLDAAGRKLIIRDFSYTISRQYATVDTTRDVSEKIVMALKKTPRDCYPTFPDSPSTDNCENLEQWIEFDTWGQCFDLRITPYSVAGGMRGWLQRYLERGASGIMFQTDRERLLQGSALNSFNIFNLTTGIMLRIDVNIDLDDVYREWLRLDLISPLEYGSCPQEPCMPKAPWALDVFEGLMKDSQKILEKTLYVRGHVFSQNAQMFDRYFLTYSIMIVQHTRDHWDAGASEKVQLVGNHMEIMSRRKQEARQITTDLRNQLESEALGVSIDIEKYLSFVLGIYRVYTETFDAQVHTAIWVRKAEQNCSAEDRRSVGETLAECDGLADRLAAVASSRGYSSNMEYVMDLERIRRFKENRSGALSELGD